MSKKQAWVPDKNSPACMLCKTQYFSMFTRRHHCRYCGNVVCAKCSSYTSTEVPGYSTSTATTENASSVRVCRDCYETRLAFLIICYVRGEYKTMILPSRESVKEFIQQSISPKASRIVLQMQDGERIEEWSFFQSLKWREQLLQYGEEERIRVLNGVGGQRKGGDQMLLSTSQSVASTSTSFPYRTGFHKPLGTQQKEQEEEDKPSVGAQQRRSSSHTQQHFFLLSNAAGSSQHESIPNHEGNTIIQQQKGIRGQHLSPPPFSSFFSEEEEEEGKEIFTDEIFHHTTNHDLVGHSVAPHATTPTAECGGVVVATMDVTSAYCVVMKETKESRCLSHFWISLEEPLLSRRHDHYSAFYLSTAAELKEAFFPNKKKNPDDEGGGGAREKMKNAELLLLLQRLLEIYQFWMFDIHGTRVASLDHAFTLFNSQKKRREAFHIAAVYFSCLPVWVTSQTESGEPQGEVVPQISKLHEFLTEKMKNNKNKNEMLMSEKMRRGVKQQQEVSSSLVVLDLEGLFLLSMNCPARGGWREMLCRSAGADILRYQNLEFLIVAIKTATEEEEENKREGEETEEEEEKRNNNRHLQQQSFQYKIFNDMYSAHQEVEFASSSATTCISANTNSALDVSSAVVTTTTTDCFLIGVSVRTSEEQEGEEVDHEGTTTKIAKKPTAVVASKMELLFLQSNPLLTKKTRFRHSMLDIPLRQEAALRKVATQEYKKRHPSWFEEQEKKDNNNTRKKSPSPLASMDLSCPICFQDYTSTASRRPSICQECGNTLCLECTTRVKQCPYCRSSGVANRYPPNVDLVRLVEQKEREMKSEK